jgi:type IV pilus assembly protein PilM
VAEITIEGVLAAAIPAPGQSPVYAFEPLPAQAVLAGIVEPNVKAPDAIAEAIRRTLSQLPVRGRSITLVIPDSSVRVFVLDFDSLPTKAAEIDSVLRFRLRKMVPFEVEHAGVSCQLLSSSKSEIRLLVAVLPRPVLTEYEAVVRQSGYEPGAVISSSLATLANLETLEAALVANLTQQSLTTAITSGDDLLLYRTLDLPTNPAQRATEIRRGIAVAAAYFEDRLGARPEKLHFAGTIRGAEFAELIDEKEMVVERMVDRPTSGQATALGTSSIAGVTGALAGAR